MGSGDLKAMDAGTWARQPKPNVGWLWDHRLCFVRLGYRCSNYPRGFRSVSPNPSPRLREDPILQKFHRKLFGRSANVTVLLAIGSVVIGQLKKALSSSTAFSQIPVGFQTYCYHSCKTDPRLWKSVHLLIDRCGRVPKMR